MSDAATSAEVQPSSATDARARLRARSSGNGGGEPEAAPTAAAQTANEPSPRASARQRLRQEHVARSPSPHRQDRDLGISDSRREAKPVDIPKEQARYYLTTLEARIRALERMQRKGVELSPIDQMLVGPAGKRIIEELRAPNAQLTEENLAYLYFGLSQELFDRSAATGVWPRTRNAFSVFISRLPIPGIRSLHTGFRVRGENAVSAYAQERHFYERYRDGSPHVRREIEQEIRDLNGALIQLQRRVFEGKLFSAVAQRTTVSPEDATRYTSFNFQNAVADNIQRICDEQGVNFQTLLGSPETFTRGMQIMNDAMQRAFLEMVDTSALNANNPDAMSTIAGQISERVKEARNKNRTASGEPDPKKVDKLKKEAATKKTKAEEAEQKAKEAKTESEGLKTKIPDLEVQISGLTRTIRTAEDHIQRAKQTIDNDIKNEITRLQGELEKLESSTLNVSDLSAADRRRAQEVREKAIASLNEQITKQEERRDKQEEIIRTAEKERDKATTDKEQKEGEVRRAKERQEALDAKKADDATQAPEESIARLEEDAKSARESADAAEEAVVNAEKPANEIEDSEEVRALLAWEAVARNNGRLAQVMDPVQREALPWARKPSEMVSAEGGDAIRETIIGGVGGPEHYDPDLAREMIPDATIADAARVVLGRDRSNPATAGELPGLLRQIGQDPTRLGRLLQILTFEGTRMAAGHRQPRTEGSTTASPAPSTGGAAETGTAPARLPRLERISGRTVPERAGGLRTTEDTLLHAGVRGEVHLGRGDGIAGPTLRFDGEIPTAIQARRGEKSDLLPISVHVRVDYSARHVPSFLPVINREEGGVTFSYRNPGESARAFLHRAIGNRAAARLTVEIDIDEHFIQALPDLAELGPDATDDDITEAIRLKFGMDTREARQVMRIFYRPATVDGKRGYVRRSWEDIQESGISPEEYDEYSPTGGIVGRPVGRKNGEREWIGAGTTRRFAARGGFTIIPPRLRTPARIRLERVAAADDVNSPLQALVAVLPGLSSVQGDEIQREQRTEQQLKIEEQIQARREQVGQMITEEVARATALYFIDHPDQRAYYLGGARGVAGGALEAVTPVDYGENREELLRECGYADGEKVVERVIYDGGEFYVQFATDKGIQEGRMTLRDYVRSIQRTSSSSDPVREAALQRRVEVITTSLGHGILRALQQR